MTIIDYTHLARLDLNLLVAFDALSTRASASASLP
jgi:hypothetical protein